MSLVLLCLLVCGISLITVVCVKRKKKKEFNISSSEMPEHIYDVPQISIAQSNPKFELTTMEPIYVNQPVPTQIEKNVAYGIFGSTPGTVTQHYT